MQGIIDFHTHAFPEELAERAMTTILEEGKKKCDLTAFLDGRVSSLLSSMDKNNIEKSVVCSIATKPSQFEPILAWSKKIASDRLVPFPSVHPNDPEALDKVSRIRQEGFRGIKFHPYYQKFTIDEKSLFPIYKRISAEGLIILMHTGFDLAFDRSRICDPEKIMRVLDNFPDLKLVTSHLGAWEDWDEVERLIIGEKVYMEISFSLDILDPKRARKMIMAHPAEYMLFGTDSPWTAQDKTLSLLKGLDLGPEREKKVLRDNALTLLNSA